MKVVLLDANSLGGQLDLSVFEKYGTYIQYGFTAPEEVVERIQDAEVIITNKVSLGSHNLPQAKKLKLICVTATGSNNIDKKYTEAKDIIVSNVVNYSTESVAQHTFAMLFYLMEHLPFYDRYVASGSYVEDRSYGHFVQNYTEVFGKVWGIIGLGNIGRRVAGIAKAFGCKVHYYSTSGKNFDSVYPSVDLDTLMGTSDIVSIHAPLNEQTEHLITYELLAKMKPTAYLLNVGRGKIIVEEDLVRAIEEERLAGVGIDVLAVEPMEAESPYRRLSGNERLLMTPHIAWASVESRRRVIAEVCKNIEAYKSGAPRCIVSE